MDGSRVSHAEEIDIAQLLAAVELGGTATPDDVTVLSDGTRLDSPEKMRRWVDSIVAERGVDR